MMKIKSVLGQVFVLAFLFLLPILSIAQDCTTNPPAQGCTTNPPSSGDLKILNPIKAESIAGLVKTILEGVIKIGIPIIALAIIYSGFLFVAARGNTEKLGTAKNSLMYTLIGAAILLGSWGIAQLITETVTAIK